MSTHRTFRHLFPLLLLLTTSLLAGCSDDPAAPASSTALDDIFTPDEAGVV